MLSQTDLSARCAVRARSVLPEWAAGSYKAKRTARQVGIAEQRTRKNYPSAGFRRAGHTYFGILIIRESGIWDEIRGVVQRPQKISELFPLLNARRSG